MLYQAWLNVFRESLESGLGKAGFSPIEIGKIAGQATDLLTEANRRLPARFFDINAGLRMLARREAITEAEAKTRLIEDVRPLFDLHEIGYTANYVLPKPAGESSRKADETTGERSFTRADFKNALRLTVQATRRLPTPDETITRGPVSLQGRRWAEISTAVAQWRGKDSVSIEQAVIEEGLYNLIADAARAAATASSAQYVVEAPRPVRGNLPGDMPDMPRVGTPRMPNSTFVKARRTSTRSGYSLADVEQSVRATLEATGRQPHRFHIVKNGPIANGKRTWHAVNVTMASWPAAERTTVARIVAAIGFEKFPVTIGDAAPATSNGAEASPRPVKRAERKIGFTRAEAIESILATIAATGHTPRYKDIIKYGPLANRNRTWNSANVTMHNWPQKTSLSQIIKAEKIIAAALPVRVQPGPCGSMNARRIFNGAAAFIFANGVIPSPKNPDHKIDGMPARQVNDLIVNDAVADIHAVCNGHSGGFGCLQDFLVASRLAVRQDGDYVPAPLAEIKRTLAQLDRQL